MLAVLRLMTPTEIADALGMDMATFRVLVGVVLGALLAFIPQTLSWIYDHYQRKQERRIAAKREVLLKAAEGAAYVGDVIASYVSGRTSWTEALKGAPGWMHKVHAVGTDATIKAFLDVDACASEAIAELELISYRIGQKQSEYRDVTERRERLSEFSKRLDEDPEYMKVLPDREKKKYGIMGDILTSFVRQDAIRKEQRTLERELMRRAVEWSSQYEGLVTTAMLEVRRELTFKGVSKTYRTMLEGAVTKSKLNVDRVFATILAEDEEEQKEEQISASPPSAD